MSEQRDSRFPDLRYIRELARVFKQYELGEIEIEAEDARILLRKQDLQPAVVPVAAPAPALVASAGPTPGVDAAGGGLATAAAVSDATYIKSPFVGTFYSKPKPDADQYAKPGDTVRTGQTVCIVEAMKLFNEIEVEFDCVVEEILVDDGHPVEFGTNLFRVRKL